MVGRLRWWAREIRAALGGEVPRLLVRARNEGRLLGHGEALEWLRTNHNGVLRPTAADLSMHLDGLRSRDAMKEPKE
jgi:hypothetical protein